MGAAAPARAGLAMSDIGRVLAQVQAWGAGLPGAERAVLVDLLRAAGLAPTTPVQFNPYLPGVHADPHDHYQQLLRDNPVHWSDAMRSWVVCRHDDVATALRSPVLSSRTGTATLSLAVPEAERGGVGTVVALAGSLLNELDPPEHTRRRRLLLRALAVAHAGGLVQLTRREAHGLLDAVAPAGRMDVVTEYAEPLAVAAATNALGVPEPDRPAFAHAVRDTVRTFSAGFGGGLAMSRGEEASSWLIDHVRRGLGRARRDGDPGTGVLPALAGAPGATDDERVLVAVNVALAFQESIAHSISSLLRTVLDVPEALAAARSPEGLPGVVEEGFRLETPAPMVSRTTTADLAIGGVVVPAGQPLLLLLAASGRDPTAFDDPGAVDPHRDARHLSFGLGRHACPGASLARDLVAMAVGTLLERCPGIESSGETPSWREELNIRGLAGLPVSFRRARGSAARTDGRRP